MSVRRIAVTPGAGIEPEIADQAIEHAVITSAPYAPQSWPIAAAMLQYTDVAWSGERVVDASPDSWRDQLAMLTHEGFDGVELASKWMDIAALQPDRRTALTDICGELGLAVRGYVLTGAPLADDAAREANLDRTRASLQAAADIGAPILCLGLHRFGPRRPGDPLWFWTNQSDIYDDAPQRHAFLVSSLRELGRRAADLGVEVTVEMYPGTAVGTAARAARLIGDVDHPAVGLNPDLGNLVRVQGQIEEWQDVVVQVLALANYWHVKNYSRAEDPISGTVLTTPSTLADGVIDYRKALRFALASGFRGTLVTEHYGGDGIAISARNRDYLRGLLTSMLTDVPVL